MKRLRRTQNLPLQKCRHGKRTQHGPAVRARDSSAEKENDLLQTATHECEAVVKPSEVARMQKALSDMVSPAPSGEQLSAKISHIWSSVVSWMKSAYGDSTECEGARPGFRVKRSFPVEEEEGSWEEPDCKALRLASDNSTRASSSGLGDLLSLEAGPCSLHRPSLLRAVPLHLEQGLNSLSPPPRGIRHPILRQYYGHSVSSPANTPVQSPAVPLPPPPPPPPPLPSIPPPPPTPGTPAHVTSSQPHSALQQLQHRLRSRMRRKGGEGGEGGGEEGRSARPEEVDIRVRQWAEIQAYSRKLSCGEFLSLAKSKQEGVEQTLNVLADEFPSDAEEIASVVELLQEAPAWYPGGSREMRESLPQYKKLEQKIETLYEFMQVTNEMRGAMWLEGVRQDPLAQIVHWRDSFASRNQHWRTILLTGARSWELLGLPVDENLLKQSRLYLCQLVRAFCDTVLQEAGKMHGVFISSKCARTSQVKGRLREGMGLIVKALPYACPGDIELTSAELLRMGVSLAKAFAGISTQQFVNFVHRHARQEICTHFEEMLKVLGLLKEMVQQVPSLEISAGTGTIGALPDSGELGSAVYSCCVKLIEHIACQAEEGLGSPRELVLWMMFGCKYVNQSLESLGAEGVNERGVQQLLESLYQTENLLPH